MADIKDIIETLDTAADGFEKVVTKSQMQIYEEAIALIKELDTDSLGRVKQSIANLKKLNAIKAKLKKVATNDRYMAGLGKFVQYFDAIAKQQSAYFTHQFAESAIDSDTNKTKRALIKQQAVDNTISALSGDGLAANVTGKINDILVRAVTSGEKFADLTEELRDYLQGKDGGQGALARYASTYATTAISQFTGQNNKLITDGIDTDWFMYVGSTKETTREFCDCMVAKRYVHRSEFRKILSGNIDGHQCRIYDKTGLPLGMIAGTDETNFQVNCGGWNCRHQLVPVHELAVPADVRARIANNNDKTPTSGFKKEGKGAKEGAKLGRAERNEVFHKLDNIELAVLTHQQEENARECAKAIGIRLKEPMTFMDADGMSANVDYRPKSPTGTNCASCVIVYEMRRRGVDVTTMPFATENSIMSLLQDKYESAWVNEKGKKPGVTIHKLGGFEGMKQAMLKQCASPGRYHIGLNWMETPKIEEGHVITAERLKDGSIIFYDPQDGEFVNIDAYAHKNVTYIESIRVDRLMVDPKFLSAISRPLGS